MARNVSAQLVDMLKEAGVKRVYAITGDSLNPVNDAIRRDGSIEWIHVRHEEAAAYAASMDAELNGIGCCMGSSGPGHVHLVNGLYDANRSGNPVIAIASTIPTSKFSTQYFQETNPMMLFQDCSKFVAVAHTAQQFPIMMQQALQSATNLRGVAVLALPGDVAKAEAVEPLSSEKVFVPKPIIRPNDAEIAKLADLINQNKKITLYCGIGAKDAVPEVLALAERLQAPIAFSFRGKIFFDHADSKYSVGMNGLLGNTSGYKACQDADVLMLLGTDFPYSEFLPEKNIVVRIDEDPARIGRRANVDYGFAGDIRDTLQALLPKLNAKTDSDFLQELRKQYEKDEKKYYETPSEKTADKKISPEAAATIINDMAADDAIFTVDTGMTSVWAARLIKAAKNRYLTGSFNHGSMANAMPMAIGAAASEKNRQVVALCGDGGLSMLLGDLATIMQYQFPVKIIVFNNRSLGMVKLEMEVAGYVDWQTDMVNPPFEKIAELMNIKGIAITHETELEEKLAEAFAHRGPVLVNIYTDPDTLAMPPKVTFDQMRGFASSMLKKAGLGQFGDIGSMIRAGLDEL